MKPDSIFEKIVGLICAVLFITALVLWTVKGLAYLDAKTRDVSLMTIEELVEELNKIPNITVEVSFWNTIYVCSPYGTFSYSDSCNLIIWQEREEMLFHDRTPEQVLAVVKALVG